MDNNTETIETFESILKQQRFLRPPALYKDKINLDTVRESSNQKLSAEALLSNIAKQIKAMQSSESFRSDKKPVVNLNKYKKSTFIPLNMLPRQTVPPQPPDPHKFETQLFSNTQLISVVEHAEALNVDAGITQEFDTTFYQGQEDGGAHESQIISKQKDSFFPILDISLKEPDPNQVLLLDNGIENKDIDEELNETLEDLLKIDTQTDNCAEILNECIEIDENDASDDLKPDPVSQDNCEVLLSQQSNTQTPLSPVFIVKPKKPISNPDVDESPLVCNLKDFENFERIAFPVIEQTLDKDEAIVLINSQIIGKELILKANNERLSPVIDISDPFKIEKELLPKGIQLTSSINSTKEDVSKEKKSLKETKESEAKESDQTDKHFLKDDILFSSDEEDDYQYESYKDLPFTCALETSFYESGAVLDKTMFVGFQTASDKSIQINTDSFCKAKSLLDSLEQDLKSDTVLTELVELYESNTIKTKSDDAKENENNKTDEISRMDDLENENVTNELATNVETAEQGDKKMVNLPQVVNDETQNNSPEDTSNLLNEQKVSDNTFISFKTASNKTIQCSEKAQEISKRVFKDIDIPKNLEYVSEFQKKTDIEKCIDINVCNNMEISGKGAGHELTEEQTIDDDIIKEFEDDLMQEEFEEILKTMDTKNSNENDTKSNDEPKLIGFRTASNKNICVSDAAIAKSKTLFQDIDFAEKSYYKTDVIEKADVFNLEHKDVGFKTASNKCIRISEDAFAKTKHIFSTIVLNDSEVDNNRYDKSQDLLQNDVEINQPSTSKSLTISPNLVSDKDVILVKPTQNIEEKKKSNNKIICAFESGMNEKISFSAEALANNEVPGDLEKNVNTFEEDIEEPFYGFEYNDKYIEKVEATIEKSQKILERLENDPDKANSVIHKFTLNRSSQNLSGCSKFKVPDKKEGETFNTGFKTASNKKIKISESAIAKSRELFQEINEEESGAKVKVSGAELCKVITQNKFEGFQTASNKEVKISKEALAKTRKIFENLNDDKSGNMNAENPDIKINFKGFQTASNKEVKISKEALAKSKKILQDVSDDNLEVNSQNFDKQKTIYTDLQFKSFHTASNKPVKISEEALAKSKKKFQDIPDNETDLYFLPTNNIDTNINIGAFKGFQTASNKKVDVSEAALAKSRKLFKDIDRGDCEEIITDNYCTRNDYTISSEFKGFQSASYKEVKISAEALANCKKIFQDIEKDLPEDVKVQNKNTKSINTDTGSMFKGFKTANDKDVQISAEALAKSKICQEINFEKFEETYEQDVITKYKHSCSFKGFQTASNKDVHISEEALAKSRQVFHDIDDLRSDNDLQHVSENKELRFKGFQTANNKNVKVSEEAIAKSRKIFQDIDADIDNHSKNSCKNQRLSDYSDSNFKGFKSANNKRIDVSEDAMLKSKKLFSEFSSEDTNIKPVAKIPLKVDQKCSENLDDIDTQMLNNFEVSMHEETPRKSKRSGSPILSCPKAKRRKVFQIPYSQKSPKKAEPELKQPILVQKPQNLYNFTSTYKKIKHYTLRDVQRLEESTQISLENQDTYIRNFSFDNILQFEFRDKRNDITKHVLTIAELKNLFLNSVNKKLVPDGWLDIQLKLVLWKLLSYEIQFPKTMSLICTATNVMEQLKYRYDKELYNTERPALRKIFERDDIPAKTLILCVAAICDTQGESVSTPELLLTDGWYIIGAVIDRMLAKLVRNGKITVGTKLVTHGAEIIGSEQAVSPWEETSSIRLKISGNSTRRARWDARLGYHGTGAILSQLSNVALDGGKISKLRVFVTRMYPPLYVDKFEDGSTVTRSERLENLYQMKYESERQALLEKIYEDVQKEVLDQDSQDSELISGITSKKEYLESGSQIAKVMRKSKDPSVFRSHLTSTQTALLDDHNTKEREKLLQIIQTKVEDKMAALGLNLNRNVVTLFKIRVAAVEEKDGRLNILRALLSIWRPNEAVIEMIKEGSWIEILNVVPTALRNSELQISAGRQSIFIQSKYKESDKIRSYILSLKRSCYPIQDLVKNPAMITDYNEIDTVGIVFDIDPGIKDFVQNKHQFQNIYLTDFEKNIISVNFWGGLKKFGFENVSTGDILACMNLQKRAGNTRKNIPQYRATEFTYFTKTPKSDIARKTIEDISLKLSKIDRKVFYKDCVSLRNNYSKIQQNSENVTPYRFPNVDINESKTRMFVDTPLAHKSNKKDENLNLTGLDFDSTFRQTDTQDLSPKTLLRKRQVKERIAKLQKYGEPPPLTPMQIVNKSKNAASAYKSPLISKLDVSTSVANSEKVLPKQLEKTKDVSDMEIQCSPVIPLNRTYVKKCAPVKLNFSNNENSTNEAVDEFSEEFDYSPPLSLD